MSNGQFHRLSLPYQGLGHHQESCSGHIAANVCCESLAKRLSSNGFYDRSRSLGTVGFSPLNFNAISDHKAGRQCQIAITRCHLLAITQFQSRKTWQSLAWHLGLRGRLCATKASLFSFTASPTKYPSERSISSVLNLLVLNKDDE